MFAGKTITLIVAMAKNFAIGLDGEMPWHLPRELAHFKQATMGYALVMGRKTHESIGRALPGRQNIVVTRNLEFTAEGCDIAHSLEHALRLAGSDEVMVIGGGELYRQALPLADRLIVTQVDCEPDADTWFPQWDDSSWQVTESRQEQADDNNEYRYSVTDLRRKNDAAGS